MHFKDLSSYTEFTFSGGRYSHSFVKIREVVLPKSDKPSNAFDLTTHHLCYIPPNMSVHLVDSCKHTSDEIEDLAVRYIQAAITNGTWIKVALADVPEHANVYFGGRIYVKRDYHGFMLINIFDYYDGLREPNLPDYVYVSKAVALHNHISPCSDSDSYNCILTSCTADDVLTTDILNSLKEATKLNIKNVIFNKPATIVFWKDGSKTVVKAQPGEKYDAEKGLALAIAKKALGNKGNYYDTLKEWLPETSNEAKKKQRRKQ